MSFSVVQNRIRLVRGDSAEIRLVICDRVTGEPFIRFYAGVPLRALRWNGWISLACRLEVLAPVSILARRPTMPSSGKAIHSLRPITSSCARPGFSGIVTVVIPAAFAAF